ncbi:hypothetical protein [Bacillus weihaiensis]|uniref:Uncharacterized protein n=1 Tax=Bacillus weihaiensis TaxID=1547283 RepID=A0A1L3MW85_9BACI|nr:hypothetical protein [Bacillus weihaiensis]APH06594.1 hypothetical protein A9C19_18800 [Bacillus weihaiensis]
MSPSSQRKRLDHHLHSEEKIKDYSVTYIHALTQLENSLFHLIESILAFQKLINSDTWKATQSKQLQFTSLKRLKLLVSLQDQVLRKYESMNNSTLSSENYVCQNYRSFKINKKNMLKSYRVLFTNPSDIIEIHKLLEELENYNKKKELLTNKKNFSPIEANPWINSTIL